MVLEAIRARRSVRAYTRERPGETLVLELLDAAVRAPTAMHREPWAFVVVQDRSLLRRLSDRAKAMWRESPVAVGWGSAAPPRHDNPSMLDDPAFNVFHDAGTLVVICRTADTRFAEADCWLAAGNLMTEAASRGLGTCCIGLALPALNAPDMKRELGIPFSAEAVAPVTLGMPAGPAAATSRRPPTILRWVKEREAP